MAAEADGAATDSQPFVPILTVMVDYGNAPFLWRVDAPEEAGVGGNICDGTGWDEGCLMSEGLWRKLADRVRQRVPCRVLQALRRPESPH